VSKSDWLDMDCALKDGSRILVWTHRNLCEIAYWNTDEYACKPKPYWHTTGMWSVKEMRAIAPLAWMPLNLPPAR